MRKNRLFAFSYYGGKYSKLKFILPNIPASDIYVEPFGGSAAVLLNKAASPNEVYNDVYENCVNFFRVLRDKPEELIHKLKLTPNSRYEFERAVDMNNGLLYVEDDVERARMFYILPLLGYFGQHRNHGNYGRSYDSHNGMNGISSKFIGAVNNLYMVADRLRGVVIERQDVFKIIDAYDREDALLYLDPPYLKSVRTSHSTGYKHEFHRFEHTKLMERVLECKCRVAISGYENPLYDKYLDGWRKVKDTPKVKNSSRGLNGTVTPACEIMWVNYDEGGLKYV